MRRSSWLVSVLLLVLADGVGAERALAQGPSLTNYWTSPPSSYTGDGGTTYADKVIDVKRIVLRDICEDVGTQAVVVASRTWIGSLSTGGWALTMVKYRYDTGAQIGSALVWPATPSATNFFVPTAMEAFQTGCGGTGDGTTGSARIVVTGYTAATSYGNTDYYTACWTGAFGLPLWSDQYSRPGFVLTTLGMIDEEPVDVDCQFGWHYGKQNEQVMIAGVTGHTWTGNSWSLQTLFYDATNGGRLDTQIRNVASGESYKACGIKMHLDATGQYANCRAHVVATYYPSGSSPSEIHAYSYYASSIIPNTWLANTEFPLVTQYSLKANAMTGFYESTFGTEYVLVAGKASGIDESHMLLAKIGMVPSNTSWHTLFSFDGGPTAPRFAEALAIDYYIPFASGIPSFIAISGYSYRDSSTGTDSIVCLYENGSSAPTLRWTAWQNPDVTSINTSDACSAVRVGPPGLATSNEDAYFVYATGQVPTSSSDMDTRVSVFSTDDTGVSPINPFTKSAYVAPVNVSGSASGSDAARAFILDPYWNPTSPTTHDFVMVGDVWDGTTTGFDILTRRYRFIE